MPESPTLQKTLLLILWQMIKEVGKSSSFLRNLKMVVEQTSLEKSIPESYLWLSVLVQFKSSAILL